MSARVYVGISEIATEFGVVDGEVVTTFSVPIGSRQLTADELTSDPPRAEELSNAIAAVGAHLDDVVRELPGITGYETVRSSSTTARVMAAVERGDATDQAEPASFLLTRQAAEDVYRTMATEKLADRLWNPGLPASEAGTIVGGCCIIVAVMRRLHLAHIEVTAHDARPEPRT